MYLLPPAMQTPPSITTDRLLLRAITSTDAEAVQRVACAFELSDTTLSIPHPYSLEDANRFLARVADGYTTGTKWPLAITFREDPAGFIGAVGLERHDPHDRAELGYWIGVPHWGKGYATEAAAALLRFGFETLNFNKIIAHCFARNPASGRVLEKIGMRREGFFRQHSRKRDRYEDIVAYGILREEFAPTRW
jgi:RimJ/RimL family protein N-acetyltransferase